jgi:hypothetical protein
MPDAGNARTAHRAGSRASLPATRQKRIFAPGAAVHNYAESMSRSCAQSELGGRSLSG